MSNSVDLRDLEAFLAVAETGSFTGAAEKLLLTQPTISARIASIEAALDTRLLDRLPGNVRPTPAGEVLLPRARALLGDVEAAIAAVRDFLGQVGGTLRVGASSIPGTYIVPKALAALHETHPGLRVQLTVEDSDRSLAALRRGDVEIAIVGRSVREQGLEETRVGEDEIVLVATPELAKRAKASRKRGVAAIEGLPLVLREEGSGTRAVALRALEAAGAPADRLHIALEIGDNAAAREAALHGAGAALLSRLAVASELADGRLEVIPVFAQPLIRQFVLVTRAGRTLTPGARELVRLLEREKKSKE